MQNHLKEILISLANHKVDFIVAGGVAVVLHGVERLTLDLDIAVKMTQENLSRFLQAMKSASLVPRVPVDAESLKDPAILEKMVQEKGALVFTFIDKDQSVRQVDVFLTKEMSYEKLSLDSVKITLSGKKIEIASLDCLLEMKRAIGQPREKDLSDIRELQSLKQKLS
jgi:hypothetical protein